MRIRVAIADDHPLYRDGLRASLGSMEGIIVVGEAADGRAAVDLAKEVRPDVSSPVRSHAPATMPQAPG